MVFRLIEINDMVETSFHYPDSSSMPGHKPGERAIDMTVHFSRYLAGGKIKELPQGRLAASSNGVFLSDDHCPVKIASYTRKCRPIAEYVGFAQDKEWSYPIIESTVRFADEVSFFITSLTVLPVII